MVLIKKFWKKKKKMVEGKSWLSVVEAMWKIASMYGIC